MNAKHIDLSAMVAAVVSATVSHVIPKPSITTAKQFLLALRSAGMVVTSDGRKFRDNSMIRVHEVQAIESFIGYYNSGVHGAQLDAARMMAQRLLNPIDKTDKPFNRGSFPIQNGFTPGTPNPISKAEQNIRARILIQNEVSFQCQQKGDMVGMKVAQSKISGLRKMLETRNFTAILQEQEKVESA
jgi:hypothetical protein